MPCHFRLVLALALTQFACKTAPAADSNDLKVTNGEEIAEEEAAAVVMLLIDDEKLCTGTFVNDFQVVTAAHCVRQRREARVVRRRFLSAIIGYKTIAVSERLHAHPLYDRPGDNAHDLGIVEFPRGSAPESIALATRPPVAGDPITLIGYGNDVIERQMDFGEMRQSGATHKRIGYNAVERIENGTILFQGYLSSAEAAAADDPPGARAGFASGDSGGAVLNADRELVGVVSAGMPKISGFDTIAAIDNIAVDVTSEGASGFLREHLK